MKLLVAGPPCGGKTTYARHIAPDLRVWDYDDLLEEEAGERYALDPQAQARARQRFNAGIPQADVVVWTAPRRMDRGRFRSQYQAKVVVVMAPMAVCLERARAERPPIWQGLIVDWFRLWEPSRSGRELVVRT